MWTTTLGAFLLLVLTGAHPTPVPSAESIGQDSNELAFFPRTYYYDQADHLQLHQSEGDADQSNSNSVYFGYVVPSGGHYHYHYPHPESNGHTYYDNPSEGDTDPYAEYYWSKQPGPAAYDYNGDDDMDEAESGVQGGSDGVEIVTDVVHGVNSDQKTPETEDDKDVFWGSYYGIDEDRFLEATNNDDASDNFPKETSNKHVDDFGNIETINALYTKKQDNNQYTESVAAQTMTKSALIPEMPPCLFIGQVMCNKTSACHYRECVPGAFRLYGVDRTCAHGLATGAEICERLDEVSRGSGKVNERLYINPCTRLSRECSVPSPSAVPTHAPMMTDRLGTSRSFASQASSDYSTRSTYVTRDNTQPPFPPTRASRATQSPSRETPLPYSTPIDISSSESIKAMTRPSMPPSTVKTTQAPTPIPIDHLAVHTPPSYAVSRETPDPYVRQTEHLSQFESHSIETTTKERVAEPLISTTTGTIGYSPTGDKQPATPWYVKNLNGRESQQYENTTKVTLGWSTTPRVVKAPEEPYVRTIPWYYDNFFDLLDTYHAQQDGTSQHLTDNPSNDKDESDIEQDDTHEPSESGTDDHASLYVVQSYDPLSTKLRPAVQQTRVPPSVDIHNSNHKVPQESTDPTDEPFVYANIKDEYDTAVDDQY